MLLLRLFHFCNMDCFIVSKSFSFAPSRLNSQLKDMYASVRNQIVDAKKRITC